MERYGTPFKEFTFKEKVAHIWEYYRWHILGTIVGGVFLISLLVTVLTPPRVYSVDIMLAGKTISNETQQEDIERFAEEFDTQLNVTVIDWNNVSEMGAAMIQKIPLLVGIGELDVLGVSPEAFDSYLRQSGSDMFQALDTIPEFEALLEENKDRLVVSGYTTNELGEIIEGEEHVYGIRVDSFKNIPSIVGTEEMVLGVTTTAKDIVKTEEMIAYLLD